MVVPPCFRDVYTILQLSGWGTILVSIDVTLSILSVVLYIAMTYHPLNVSLWLG